MRAEVSTTLSTTRGSQRPSAKQFCQDMEENDMENILEVRDLRVWFPIKKGVFALTSGYVKAVDGVSFDLRRGETLGVVGESGCGKSTTSRAILLLNKPCGGTIKVNGVDITKISGKDEMKYRRTVQVVFQDPHAALNPRHTVLDILTEGMIYHGLCKPEERREKATELLKAVGMPLDILDRYPHEFSGGQRQRLCIARAISLKPELLICDEAVSALDLTIRAQVLDLLEDLKKKLGLSILFITHDLGVVQHVADRIIVMNKGKIVESGDASEVLKHPKNEYTKRLMASVPKIGKPLS
ncbi:MAG: ABC transporter ATP-binding protein [Lentisphaerae bacterium]|nr:ABC transporter ATP-binding protein [Lentisphaerota bacterium]